MKVMPPCRGCEKRAVGCRKECRAYRAYEIQKLIMYHKKMQAVYVQDYFMEKHGRLEKKLGGTTHMNARDIVIRYRGIWREIDTIQQHAARILSSGAPAGLSGMDYKGDADSRRTNMPEAARLQLFEGTMALLDSWCAEDRLVCSLFPEAVRAVENLKARDVIHRYYALEQTDESIAESYETTTQYINNLRNEALRELGRIDL